MKVEQYVSGNTKLVSYMDRSSQQNNDDFFDKAYDEWDFDRLVSDLEKIEHLARHQKRNLKAILLSFSPKKVATLLGIQASSLRPAFSNLYRLIENLTQEPSNTVTYKNAKFVLALASYRKQKNSLDGSLIDEKSKALVQSPQPPTNPQNIHTPEPIPELTPLDFIGRDRDLTNLANLSRQPKIVLIKAGAGVGKSTLAREFLQTQFEIVIRIEMGLESGNVITPAEEKVSQILRKDFDEEPSRDFGINLDILREKLADRVNPIGVLIDNLEPALDENYRFREKLRGYDALLTVLGDRDVCSFTLITSRRSLTTLRAKVHEYSLEGLDITAWRQYFYDCENGADSDALLRMRDAYNGNAKVMDILHGAIKNRFDGNIGAYWSRYKDALLADSELETLISMEMDWLRDNQPDAYKLLCRMGCYRYQDVKTVPFEGLICLLWDVLESRRVGVVGYLSKSSLIEIKGGYYLHPAVREAAKLRLMKNQIDWKSSNIEAIRFYLDIFIKSLSRENDLYSFEAFEHYLIIKNAEDIFLTLQNPDITDKIYRVNSISDFKKYLKKFKQELESVNQELMELIQINLATASYYLSEYTSAIEILEPLCKDAKNDDFKRLATLKLCACYVDTGQLKSAIKIGEKTLKEIEKLKHNEQIHLLNLVGDAYRYLGDYHISLDKHKFALEIAIKENMNTYTSYSKAYIAYCETSQLEFSQDFSKNRILEIINTLENVIDDFKILRDSSSELIASCYLTKLYLYIGKKDLAKKYYDFTNASYKTRSREAHFSSPYLQDILFKTSAKLSSFSNEFNNTVQELDQSISLAKKMGSKFSLAESYFQLGLTYQAMREHDQAEIYKAKALKLFEQMEAPKQIERVNKAFEQGGM